MAYSFYNLGFLCSSLNLSSRLYYFVLRIYLRANNKLTEPISGVYSRAVIFQGYHRQDDDIIVLMKIGAKG
jgi:hypothetical protein